MEPFDKIYDKEILKSERKRSIILIALLLIEVVSLFVIYSLYKEEYLQVFKTNISIFAIIFFTTIIIAYDILINYIIGLKSNFIIAKPEVFGFINSFFEISLLTVLLVVIIEKTGNIFILNSPATLTYFIFIILSTFRLNFKLSVFSGLLAAIEFVSVAIFYSKSNISGVTSEYFSTNTNIQFLGQGIILFISGIGAGFVANIIKSKMKITWETMKEKNEVINLFGQQISHSIADNILQNKNELLGVRKNVCIMFLDIRKFTNFVDNKQPEEVVAYLNSLFSFMIDIVEKHNGVINQFLGDGFMATFGAPVSIGNSSQNATNASSEIIEKLNIEYKKGNIRKTKIGIGLHYDEAVTGNIGSSLRKQYSITGKVVIMASRIEQLNKKYGTEFLLSEKVYTQLNEETKSNFKLIDKTKVKGSNDIITLYNYEKVT